jgi:hypothetical protein
MPAAMSPFPRMGYNSSPYHIEINICQASDQMLVRIHGCGMIAIFPKGPFSILSLIIFLPNPACHKLHCPRDDFTIIVTINKDMNMI